MSCLLFIFLCLYLLLDLQQFCLDSFIFWCYLLSFLKTSQCLNIFFLILAILGLHSALVFDGSISRASKQLSTAPCWSDIFRLEVLIFSTQLEVTGCSFAPSASSAAAREPSTYLENSPIQAASNTPLRHSACDSLITCQFWYESSPMLVLIFLMTTIFLLNPFL